MIQSKRTFFGTTLFLAMVLLILLMIPGMTKEVLATDKTSILGWSIVIGLFIMLLMICLYFVKDTQNLSVDHDKITYTNWLTGKMKIYFFKDFDGYVTIARRSRFKEYESVLLMKGKKRIGEISSFYYSNYNELVDGLKKELKYLGQEDYDMIESIKRKFDD